MCLSVQYEDQIARTSGASLNWRNGGKLLRTKGPTFFVGSTIGNDDPAEVGGSAVEQS